MIDHIGIEVSDYEKAKSFYAQVLAPIGYELLMEVQGAAGFGMKTATGPLATFWIHQGENPTYRAHIAFTAPNRAAVDAFHKTALAAGGTCHGKPGLREIYHPNYYGSFVLDFDGHNIEAVCHHG